MTNQEEPRKWSEQEKVETVILDIAVERRRLTTDAMLGEVVIDPDDERELRTARKAISSLREHGLLKPEREDETLEPTPAAIKAAALRI